MLATSSKMGGPCLSIGLARFDWSPAKKAANSWNCCRFQGSVGWSWHWAHWICTPMKTRETSPASSTAWAFSARPNSDVQRRPFSWFEPSAVMTSAAISSQGRPLANRSASQTSKAG